MAFYCSKLGVIRRLAPDIVHFSYGEYHNDSFRLLSLHSLDTGSVVQGLLQIFTAKCISFTSHHSGLFVPIHLIFAAVNLDWKVEVFRRLAPDLFHFARGRYHNSYHNFITNFSIITIYFGFFLFI